ncbi:MAG: hypothetical protein II295_06030 [Akkermansia sp.]|nr:hypothetical protein [Akkermansia sp.]
MRIRVLPEVTRREKIVAAVLMYGGAVLAGGGYLLLAVGATGCRGYHLACLLGGLAAMGGNVLQALGQYACWVNDYRREPWIPRPRWKLQWLRLQAVGLAVAACLMALAVMLMNLLRLYFEMRG